MVNCHRCQQEFPFQWRLDRHLARKFPCKEQDGQMNHKDGQMNHKDGQMNHEDGQMNHEDGQMNHLQCHYCFRVYSTVGERNRHLSNCRMRDDHIRNMELELDINNYQPKNELECRFCFKYFTTKSNLSRHIGNCKAKQDYRSKLEKQLEEKHAKVSVQTINNNITNNITQNNNITIRAFGKENMDYITREVVLKLCRKANLRNEIIPRLVRQLHCNPKHPENHNIVVTNLRAPYAKIYDGENYMIDATKDIIDKVMDSVAGLLTDECAFGDDDKFKPYERAIERIEEDMNETESKFKSEQRVKVKRDLYNNKKMLERSIRSINDRV